MALSLLYGKSFAIGRFIGFVGRVSTISTIDYVPKELTGMGYIYFAHAQPESANVSLFVQCVPNSRTGTDDRSSPGDLGLRNFTGSSNNRIFVIGRRQ